jgi:putative phage-type endonuclease
VKGIGTDAVLIAPPGLDRDEWLEIRRGGIGGSDIGAIAGFSRYNTPFGVWLDKTEQLPDGPRSPVLERCARVGTKIEAFIAEIFAEETGTTVHTVGTLARRDKPWMRVNLDRRVEGCPDGPCLLEIKNRSQYVAGQWDDGVPDDTECQAHWGLAITGWSHAHVAVLIGGNDPRFYRIERDEQLLDGLTTIAAEFWDRVQRLDPPPIGPTEADADILARLYAEADEDAVAELSAAEVKPWLDQRAAAVAAIKRAEEAKTEAENHLKALCGPAVIAKAAGEVAFTWKPTTARRINVTALKAALPDVHETYLVESRTRRFSIPRGNQ